MEGLDALIVSRSESGVFLELMMLKFVMFKYQDILGPRTILSRSLNMNIQHSRQARPLNPPRRTVGDVEMEEPFVWSYTPWTSEDKQRGWSYTTWRTNITT